jgi:hypothetical protein
VEYRIYETNIQNPPELIMNQELDSSRSGRKRFDPLLLLAGALALVVSATGCDTLDRALRVEAPGLVDAEQLLDPAHAQLLVNGTIADFECALGAYIVNSSLLGNELRDASVTASRFPLDARTIEDTSPYGSSSCTGSPPGIYVPLSTAIWSANNTLRLLDGWTDAEVKNRTALIAQTAAYSGYSHTLMGEGFCSTVITEEGPEVAPQAVFEAAEARFTRAIEAAQAANDAETLNMARVGRARVRLNLGNTSGAASDARDVLASDPTFVKEASASIASSRRYNRIGSEFFGGFISVAPMYRDLMVDGVPDPRTAVIDVGNGHNRTDTVFLALKIGSERVANTLREEPVPIATWREARLIIAEAEGGAEAVAQINVLRAHHGLPEFSSTDEAVIRNQVIEERQRELFLEGHHLNDLRRFSLPLVPEPESNYRQGGLYGDVRCFPLPAVERNTNPNV